MAGINYNTKRAGFTIIELICVISIIAFLVALLLPSLNVARSQAVGAICMSNMKAYGSFGQMYLDEYDEVFPNPEEWLYARNSDSRDHPIGCRWHDREMRPGGEMMVNHPELRGAMWSYFKEYDYLICPTFRDEERAQTCENPKHNSELFVDPQYSYTMNGYLGSDRKGGVKTLSEVSRPSEVFFFGEENAWSIPAGGESSSGSYRGLKAALSTQGLDDAMLLITPTPEVRDCIATYHGQRGIGGFGHVVFVDGHVERISKEDQLRKNLHGGSSEISPAGNLYMAWASKELPEGGWEKQ